MNKATAITCLHHARKRASTTFKLDLAEMEDRHHLTFDTYEEGKLTPFTRAHENSAPQITNQRRIS